MSFLVFSRRLWLCLRCCYGGTPDEKIEHESFEKCKVNLNTGNVILMTAGYSALAVILFLYFCHSPTKVIFDVY